MKFAILTCLTGFLAAQTPPAEPGVPVRMVITAEPHHHAKQTPQVAVGDVSVFQGKDRRPVIDWTPLTGDRAQLQLAILIDDGADSDLALQFNDLKAFLQRQPASTQFGVFYMRDGTAFASQNFTADRATLNKALRLPIGRTGINASPYLSLEDLVKRWPETNSRREVLMLGSGIDYLYNSYDLQNPYLDHAIEVCQRAGVLVHSIYYSGAGHFGHSYFRNNIGQDYLSKLAEETGGESFYQGLGNPVSFQPFLRELADRLQNQYLLTFRSKVEKKASYERVKLRTELPDAELVGATDVYVTGDH